MLDAIFRFFGWGTPFCKHDWEFLGTKVKGVTLSWAATPVRNFDFNYRCRKCQKEKSEQGYLYGDRRLNPECYGEDGWPIDENGNRLPIAH